MHRRPFKPKYVDDNKYTKNFQDPNKFYNDQTNIKDHRNITNRTRKLTYHANSNVK